MAFRCGALTAAPRLQWLSPGYLKSGRRVSVRLVSVSAAGDDKEDGVPVQDAVLKVISEVSKVEKRQTTNVVMGGTSVSDDWRALDDKVNSYPMKRAFTAIGVGGEDFVHAMIIAVEKTLECSVPEGEINRKMSSKGKYVSVKIGPVLVVSSEQVQAIYNAMKCDERLKYFF